MIRIIRISSLHRHQLHTPELGLCQSGFPCSARLVLSVCLHTEGSCVNGRVRVMNGEEGWETDPVNADIPKGSPHRATAAQMPSLLHGTTTENKRTNDP